ncbi:hypothetical protein B484DRAFT_423621 [Ochromonadaceae sp. CCMP2298]|nr:hypothetical protein B484DRAFT_423621 [Ochromonadaceae sp. CCMP2298]
MLIEDVVNKHLGDMLLQIITMLLFFASVILFLEQDFQEEKLTFFTWMYYVWITITTVGYGDISPMSTQGRAAAMFFVGSRYRSSTKHIVICGSLNSITLESFFEELFHEDHNNIGLSTVVLVPHPPSLELQVLISTVYSHAVIFLEGSAMLQKDLRRADVQGAEAVFVLTDKFSYNPDREDAKAILLNLSIKRYFDDCNVPCALLCTQLIKPQNRKHLGREDHDDGGLEDRDLIVCLNELKMGIMANNVPPHEEGEEGKTTPVGPTGWINDYSHGVTWEIYTTALAPAFEGSRFNELSFALYKKLGVVLFALQDYVVLAFVVARTERAADLNFTHEARKEAAQPSSRPSSRPSSLQRSSTSPRRFVRSLSPERGSMGRAFAFPAIPILRSESYNLFSPVPEPAPEPKERQERQTDEEARRRRRLLPSGQRATFLHRERLIRIKEDHFRMSYYVREKPAKFFDVTITGTVFDVVPQLSKHTIIIGTGIILHINNT